MVVHALPLYRRGGELAGIAIVDREDFGWASKWRWSLTAAGYAVRAKGKRYLHREVLGLEPGDPLMSDHRNGARLDCRRENLRTATAAENAQNRGAMPGSTSRYRGVSWDAARGRWRAQVTLDRRNHPLGRFDDEEDAAAAVRAFLAERVPFAVDR